MCLRATLTGKEEPAGQTESAAVVGPRAVAVTDSSGGRSTYRPAHGGP